MEMTMRAVLIFLMASLMATSVSALEVSGEWTAEVEGRRGGSTEITMNLKAEDGLVTGTVRSANGEAPISAGSIQGDNISFSIITELDGYQIREHFRGTVEGDVIHFSLTVEDGRDKATPVRDFDAKRVD